MSMGRGAARFKRGSGGEKRCWCDALCAGRRPAGRPKGLLRSMAKGEHARKAEKAEDGT